MTPFQYAHNHTQPITTNTTHKTHTQHTTQVTYGPLDVDGYPAEACIDGPREIDLAMPSFLRIASLTLVPSS